MRAIALLMLGCGVLGCVKGPAAPSDAALSFLEDAPEGCVWKFAEPLLGKTETIATIQGQRCEEFAIAWHGDAKQALLSTSLETWKWSGETLEKFTSAGPREAIAHAAFDAIGLPTVVTTTGGTIGPPSTSDFPRLRPLDFENLTDDELLYRLETTAPWEPPEWVVAGSNQVTMSSSRDRSVRREVVFFDEYLRADPSVRRTMSAADARRDVAPPWRGLRIPSGLVIANRGVTLVFETKERRAFIPEGAPLAVSTFIRGDHLLVLEKFGSAPRLYDARTGDLVWSAPKAHAASFWPKLASTK